MSVYPDPKQLLNDPRIKESLEKLRQMLPELKEKRDYYRRVAKEEKRKTSTSSIHKKGSNP